MDIDGTEALRHEFPLLVRLEAQVRESFSPRLLLHLGQPWAGADDEENDAVVVLELRGGGEEGIELVDAAKVARVADDELVAQVPCPPQGVVRGVDRNDRCAIRPVVDHLDAIVRHAILALEVSGHEVANHHHAIGDCERVIPHAAQRGPAQSSSARHPVPMRDFREKILQPHHRTCAETMGQRSHGTGGEGRVGLDHHDVPGSDELARRTACSTVVADVAEAPAQKTMRRRGCLCYAMNRYAVRRFNRHLRSGDPACYRVHVVAQPREVEGEVGDDLAGGGSIGKEESIEEENLHPRRSAALPRRSSSRRSSIQCHALWMIAGNSAWAGFHPSTSAARRPSPISDAGSPGRGGINRYWMGCPVTLRHASMTSRTLKPTPLARL